MKIKELGLGRGLGDGEGKLGRTQTDFSQCYGVCHFRDFMEVIRLPCKIILKLLAELNIYRLSVFGCVLFGVLYRRVLCSPPEISRSPCGTCMS